MENLNKLQMMKFSGTYNATFLSGFSKPLVYINKRLSEITIEEINYKFISEQTSYLPILKSGNRELETVLSRKKYFQYLLQNENGNLINYIKTDSIPIIEPGDSLDSVLGKLKSSSGLILREDGFLTKFISPKDVVDALNSFSSNYILIQSIETRLRQLIGLYSPNFINILAQNDRLYLSPDKVKKNIDDLVFSDYILVFKDSWQNFETLRHFSQNEFLKRLQEINEFRNGLFHFRNDAPNEKASLTNFLNIIN